MALLQPANLLSSETSMRFEKEFLMQPDHSENQFNRRNLLLSAGLLAALGMSEVQAGGHTGGKRKILSEAEQAALEKSNETLVNNFVRDYATRDVDILAAYMADDIIYQISEGQPEVVGVEAYKKRNASMFDGLEKVDWKILRSFAIGQLVINDRIDEFYPKPGSRVPRMRFRVSGYFLIVDDKIKIWRDFGYPGAKQLIEPAPKA
jgi:limonene-1,2-epoxide hydrolase